MATAVKTTEKSLYDRALRRAHDSGLSVTGQGRTLATGSRFFTVPSLSEPGRSHVVTVDGARLHCDCQAGQNDRYCQHRALVHEYLTAERERRQQHAARDAQARAEERDEEARRSADGSNGGQSFHNAPRLRDECRPVSMWR